MLFLDTLLHSIGSVIASVLSALLVDSVCIFPAIVAKIPVLRFRYFAKVLFFTTYSAFSFFLIFFVIVEVLLSVF